MSPDEFNNRMYEQLVTMNDRLLLVYKELSELRALLGDTREEQADHEVRIRSLERWRYGIPLSAVMGIISAVASIVVTFSRTTGKP